MKCPHCLESFHEKWTPWGLEPDSEWPHVEVLYTKCPACGRTILMLSQFTGGPPGSNRREQTTLLYPKTQARKIQPDVPDRYSKKYAQACAIVNDSPEASAALSRRILQTLLREHACVKPSDLANEIQEVLDSHQLPGHLAEAIDAVRNVGNFGAHPIKSKNTGEIVEVEAGEAEWLVDVLEGLFDFYIVQPAILAKKKAALNAKLAASGKPPMKSP
jgi:hypothetical protein